MKVAIVIFNNLFRCPYALTYANYFDKHGIDYRIIEFDRSGEADCRCISIQWEQNKSKIHNFLHFRKEVKRLLKNNFDFVAVLTTIPGVLLCSFLNRCFSGKYIIDIRDYTLESHFLFRCIEKKLITKSRLSVISSPGFINFLPKNKYVLCHNLSQTYYSNSKSFIKKTGKPIVIGYIGTIAYKEECIKMIKTIEEQNDALFVFHMYGEEVYGTEVASYISNYNVKKTIMFGKYNPSEKNDLIQKVDILFNVYGNNSPLLVYALSNKLYDSFYHKKPLLTSPNTEMSNLSNGFSFDVDFNNPNILRDMYKWYSSINSSKFEKYANEKMQLFIEDQRLFYDSLDSIFEVNKNAQ